MENDDVYRNLVILIKIFKDRPYHFARFLIDNSSLSEEFLQKIKKSEKLKELSAYADIKLLPSYFNDISQMNDYYNSLINDLNQLYKEKNIEEITKDINIKLDNLIKLEKYEDAARIRDYMSKNNIKRSI